MIVGIGQSRRAIRLASVDTLVRLAEQGKDGRHWYRHAREQVFKAADILGEPRWVFADYLAIFSPRVSVKRNIRFAVHYVTTGDFAHDVMRGVKAAIEHYEQTAEIRGPKTSAFAKAIMGDGDAVVLDVWMAVAFGVDQREFSVNSVRAECTARIRKAAARLGWTAAETQAAIWCATVRNAGRRPGTFTIVTDTLYGPQLENAA